MPLDGFGALIAILPSEPEFEFEMKAFVVASNNSVQAFATTAPLAHVAFGSRTIAVRFGAVNCTVVLKTFELLVALVLT